MAKVKNFVYKKSTVTSMKVVGIYDAQALTVDVEEEGTKSLKTLLSEFEGANIELTVKIKDEADLDEPSEE